MSKFSLIGSKAKVAALTAMVFITNPMSVLAQTTGGAGSSISNYGATFLDEMDNQVKGLGEVIVSILRTALGIGALVSFVIVVIKLFNEDREAAKKLAFWVLGLTIGFIGLSVVANMVF